MKKLFKINMELTNEELDELIERLECEEYSYIGETERQQEKYEKKIREMRDKMIEQIKSNLKLIYNIYK